MISFVIVHVTYTCNLENTNMGTQNGMSWWMGYMNYLESQRLRIINENRSCTWNVHMFFFGKRDVHMLMR